MPAQARLEYEDADVRMFEHLVELTSGDECRERYERGSGPPDTEGHGQPVRTVAGQQPDVRAGTAPRALERLSPPVCCVIERCERERALFTRNRTARAMGVRQRAQEIAESGSCWHLAHRLWHMAAMEKIRALARTVSNWGRWGADDERGTFNFITPDVVRRAAACVQRGQVFSLGLPFGADGPQIGQGGRVNPLHLMSAVGGGYGTDPEGFRYNDDVIIMPLQCATQWDSLAHVYYGGQLYNGFPASTTTAAGATRNAIDKLGAGIVSRGVLLDIARVVGVDRLPAGRAITPADFAAAERAQGVRVAAGDVLLVRTGHLTVFTKDGNREGYMRQMPGLGVASVEWLHTRQVAAVATDTSAVEVIPFEDPTTPLPVHLLCIRDMGLTLGEMFDLEELAADCARDGVWEFLFTAPPLKVTGGVGSPLNPLAVK
jgi:kynurenine formamidase